MTACGPQWQKFTHRRVAPKRTRVKSQTSEPPACFGANPLIVQVLQRLREETAALRGARMQITPEQGQFMAQLAQLLGVRKYLEIGVFTGYSALAVALALPPDGTVVALERDPRPLEMAKRFWGEAGVSNKVECRVGPAAEALPEVAKSHGRTFDMAFVGAPPVCAGVATAGAVACPTVANRNVVCRRALRVLTRFCERL